MFKYCQYSANTSKNFGEEKRNEIVGNGINSSVLHSCVALWSPTKTSQMPSGIQGATVEKHNWIVSFSWREKACKVCEYRRGLTLPHLPDMVFPDNVLRLVRRDDGVGIEFNALDALKRVDDKGEPVKVLEDFQDFHRAST